MRLSSAVPAGAALVAALGVAAPAVAATPPPTTVRAAELATQKAREFLFQLRQANGTMGTGRVTLQQIGRTRTRITLRIPPASSAYSARLYPGTECNDQRNLASTLTLAPLNAAGANAPVSQSIVELPIEQVSKNYVVDVRKATERRAVTEACAHLR